MPRPGSIPEIGIRAFFLDRGGVMTDTYVRMAKVYCVIERIAQMRSSKATAEQI